MPDLSIIIPTKNRPDLLEQCFKSIKKYFFDIYYEIVVVETGDDIIFFDNINCKYYLASNATFSQACNLGASKAISPYLLLCNNDIIFEKKFKLNELIERILGYYDDCPLRSIVGFKLIYKSRLVQHAGTGFDLDGNPYHLWDLAPEKHPETNEISYPPAVCFACAIVPKAMWDELGGLDENYINSYEDVDFCLRAREAGQQVMYEPSETIMHLGSQTPGRNEGIAPSWDYFQKKWIVTGRLYKVLGMYPLSTR